MSANNKEKDETACSKALKFKLAVDRRVTKMADSQNYNEKIQKLRKLIKDVEIGMLTTIDEDGKLHSRPMSTNSEVEFDGDLWFFTYASSHKVTEVEQHQQVNVSFSNPDKQEYISISGKAQLVRDRQKMQQLWKPELKAWFPKELDEPDIALLKVNAEKAEYWDAPSGFVAHAISLVKAVTTGETATTAQNEKLSIK
jgi:general stress protein 26